MIRFKGSRRLAGGLGLAAAFALTALTGVAQQQQQGGPAQGDGQARAGRPWGHGGADKGRRGGRARGGDFFGGRFGAELNLTDAQREQMRQIAERYSQTFSAQREQRRGEARGGFDPLAGGVFDEAAVRAAAQARASAQVEREVAHARMMSEMYNVLTAEQKAQLAAARQQRQQRRQEMRGRRGLRQGQTQLQ
ncbi:MAG TPA: Spy/CpxP family protein refolding chaperone [Pyrinomonadaceae bacterium]|jgi:Spy/CpxP family protein refolding chaperone